MAYAKLLLSISLSLLLFSFSQVYATSYDYCDVLHKSLLFYEAQRSGPLPSTNRVPWRGNSALGDCTSILCVLLNGIGNLDGGYYDAGDGVKFMFPQTWSMTTLSWSMIEFKSAVDACGETQNFLNTIRWGTDFILKCHTSDMEFWGQIGNGGIDHSWWGPPELMTMARPTYKISSTAPGTELALEAASALAAASMVFKTVDPTYSATLLAHSRTLYTLGYNYRGFYHVAIPDAANYYQSQGYNDELVWGSSWLYRATGESAYLTAAKSDYATYNMGGFAAGQGYDWDQKSPGVIINMWKATGSSQYYNDAQSWLNSWYQGGGKTYTPGGLVWQSYWGTLRYAASASFLAMIVGDTRSTTWAKSQIDYMLGTNNQGRSFVCGFGNNSPINPHHRAAHGSTTNDINNPVNNLHILTGALVGGPDQYDNYADVRTDYVKNEVALDYNAGFTGAVAALAGMLKLSAAGGNTTSPSTVAPTTTTTPTPTTSKASTTAAAPPISQATSRPSTTASPTTPSPTTSSPTTTTTTTPTTTTSGAITIQLNSGSSTWWFGANMLSPSGVTLSKMEFTDGGIYNTYTAMSWATWGCWIFSPSAQLVLPITLRLTTTGGQVALLTNVITSLTQFAPMLTTQQFGQSARNTNEEDRARIRAIEATPANAHTAKLHVHQGSSVWWLACALFDTTKLITSVEIKDGAGLDFTLRDGKWGYWILETQGTALSLPLTVTATSELGASISFTVTDFHREDGVLIDSGTHY